MASEPELRREIADQRRELTNAVADLRVELDKTAERGKRIGVTIGVVTGAALALRTAVRIRRHYAGD